MTFLELNTPYAAYKHREGESNRGRWELISVVDPNRKNEITIFTDNIPCGVAEGTQFRITKFTSVRYGFKKDKNDKWQPQVTVNATVAPVHSEFEELDTSEPMPWGELDDGLPL